MKVYSQELFDEICKEHKIEFAKANIMEVSLLSGLLEQRTGNELIHMELGSPSLTMNRYGIEAEIEALKAGVGARYAPTDGLPVLKQAASRFTKAFLDLDIDPKYFIPTVGAMQGSFGALAVSLHRFSERKKILVLEPSFHAYKAQAAILGYEWKGLELADCRSEKLLKALEAELSTGEYAAIVYSNPNNPAWICLADDELRGIAALMDKYDVIAVEDLAYFCMDNRTPGFSVPYCPPYPPTIARYTSNCILLLSASKIFTYAGQRIGVMCVPQELFDRHCQPLADRYKNPGYFGNTLSGSILDMVTSGVAASVQHGLANMMQLSCDGVIDFVADTSEYARRAHKMKEIFLRHGFNIIYDKDLDRDIADGFFFTLGYKGMESIALCKELLLYGVSVINLKRMGSSKEGARICSSRIQDHQFDLLEQRMAEFEKDHKVLA